MTKILIFTEPDDATGVGVEGQLWGETCVLFHFTLLLNRHS